MASAFELLEAYALISERGADLVIAKMARVRQAAIAATQPVSLVVTSNADSFVQTVGVFDDAMGRAALSADNVNGSVRGILDSFDEIVDEAIQFDRVIEGTGRKSGRIASSVGASFGSLAKSVAGAAAAYFTIDAAIRLVATSLEEAGAQQRSEIAFRQIIGSAEEAERLLKNLASFARETPFSFPELRETAQQLLALGSASENIIDEIRILSDVAAGSGAALSQISRVYTQVRAKQQLYAEELQQFGDAGVPILQTLAEVLQTNEAGVRRLAEQGRVSFADVEEAFRRLTSEGGKFADLTRQITQTLPGSWARFKDEVVQTGAALAGLSVDGLSSDLQGAIILLGQLREAINLSASGLDRLSESLFGTDFRTQTPFGALADYVDYRNELERLEESFARVTTASERAAAAAGRAAESGSTQRWAPLRKEIEETALTLEEFNSGKDPFKQLLESLTNPDINAAESIRQSVLTPLEELEEKFLDLRSLFNQGLLSEDIYSRALDAALRDFDELLLKQRQFQQSAAKTSFNVGTTQAFTFRIQQSNEQRQAAALQRQQTELQAKANQLLEDINGTIGEAIGAAEVTEDTFQTEIF